MSCSSKTIPIGVAVPMLHAPGIAVPCFGTERDTLQGSVRLLRSIRRRGRSRRAYAARVQRVHVLDPRGLHLLRLAEAVVARQGLAGQSWPSCTLCTMPGRSSAGQIAAASELVRIGYECAHFGLTGHLHCALWNQRCVDHGIHQRATRASAPRSVSRRLPAAAEERH